MTAHEILDRQSEQLPLLVLAADPAAAPVRHLPRTNPSRRRVPARLRIDETTRQVGLAGVAEARAILAAQAERRLQRELPERRLPVRRQAA